jgi:hypothetical protein
VAGAFESVALDDVVPPQDAISYEGVLSVVVDDPAKKVRRLPSLYFGQSLIAVDRDVDALVRQASAALDVLLAARTEPSYLMSACRVGDVDGLYVKDLCARSDFRRKLEKQGMEISPDFYVRLTDDARWWTPDWGVIDPRFLVMVGEPADPSDVARVSPGELLFGVASLRMGVIPAPEMPRLTRALRGVEGVGSAGPETLLLAIDELA